MRKGKIARLIQVGTLSERVQYACMLLGLVQVGACAERPSGSEVVVAPVAPLPDPLASAPDAAVAEPPPFASAIDASPPALSEATSDAEPLAPDASDLSYAGIHRKLAPLDPLQGVFTLDDATRGLPKTGSLVATIATDLGTLRCNLFTNRAPVTVANFVGLARGVRPWLTQSGQWESRPAYDGTTFHRVIPGFMIQGGDPLGTGAGEPGFVFADEPWAGAKHDRAGLLCIANRGPNTNGMQFFITDAATPHLDGGSNAYTIFGECAPLSVVHALAKVHVVGSTPVTPLHIKKVTITRAGKTAPAPASPAPLPVPAHS